MFDRQKAGALDILFYFKSIPRSAGAEKEIFSFVFSDLMFSMHFYMHKKNTKNKKNIHFIAFSFKTYIFIMQNGPKI